VPTASGAQNYGPPDLWPSVRIVLTSVLKPVTDPRLLARLGRTLAELPGAEVHILAHVAADAPTTRPDTERPNIFLHPIFDFPRLSLNRALAGQRLLRKLRELRPDVLVIGAAELLPAGLQWQRRTKGKLVYDVRENYALNVRTQGVFPPLIASALAARIERMEAAAAPHLAGALLAERVYAEQLPWLKACKRVEIIENKYQPTILTHIPHRRTKGWPEVPLRLLVSGTLSDLYGTFRAIEFVESLVAFTLPGSIELTIVGYAPRYGDYEYLLALTEKFPWLHLVGGDEPVPHALIIDHMRASDLALLPYLDHPSLTTCIPTKLWECLGEALPVVVPPNPLWSEIVNRHQAGFVVDFEKSGVAQELIARLGAGNLYPEGVPPEAFWSTEAARLSAFFLALS
jgi:glycogen synthase